MSDTRLEEKIRGALRADADGWPMTISEAELERRLTLRRRERSDHRRALVAAAALVVAVGSFLAIGGGWVRLPAVGVDATPSPAATAPVPSAAAPTRAPASGDGATTDPERRPLGASDEAVVVRFSTDGAGPVTLEVDLLRDVRSIPTVFSATLPAGRVPSDDPPRVSPDGYLAVPLADAADPQRERGVAVYDLLDESRAPDVFDTDEGMGSSGVAWSHDGQLAIFDPLAITVVRPFGPSEWSIVNVPADVAVVAYGPAADEVWAADGRGFEAWRNVADPPSGILRLDGSFEPASPPSVFVATGNERRFDAAGRVLTIGCTSITGTGEVSGCGLLAERLGDAGEIWYEATLGERIVEARWDADRQGAWLLVEQAATDGGDGLVELRHGDASGFAPVASAPDVGDPVILGISADDARLALDLGNGVVQSVPSTPGGEWGGIDGVFAGWADQRGGGG